MDGAINPSTISGTQKVMIWPRMYLIVTVILRTAMEIPLVLYRFRISPAMIPRITATSSLNGRLLKKDVFFIGKTSSDSIK